MCASAREGRAGKRSKWLKLGDERTLFSPRHGAPQRSKSLPAGHQSRARPRPGAAPGCGAATYTDSRRRAPLARRRRLRRGLVRRGAEKGRRAQQTPNRQARLAGWRAVGAPWTRPPPACQDRGYAKGVRPQTALSGRAAGDSSSPGGSIHSSRACAPPHTRTARSQSRPGPIEAAIAEGPRRLEAEGGGLLEAPLRERVRKVHAAPVWGPAAGRRPRAGRRPSNPLQ